MFVSYLQVKSCDKYNCKGYPDGMLYSKMLLKKRLHYTDYMITLQLLFGQYIPETQRQKWNN